MRRHDADGQKTGGGTPEDQEVRELIARARAGDRGALDALIRRYRPRLERLIRARWRQQDAAVSASDIVQDASRRVFLKLHGFHGQDRREFEAWLWQIARSEFIAEVRAV